MRALSCRASATIRFRRLDLHSTVRIVLGRGGTAERRMGPDICAVQTEVLGKERTTVEKILPAIQRTNDHQLRRCRIRSFSSGDVDRVSVQKFQEQIRTFFAHSNENVNQLLHREMPERLKTCSRECYINVATCLQKRAYDITNDMALDMHKQLVRTHGSRTFFHCLRCDAVDLRDDLILFANFKTDPLSSYGHVF